MDLSVSGVKKMMTPSMTAIIDWRKKMDKEMDRASIFEDAKGKYDEYVSELQKKYGIKNGDVAPGLAIEIENALWDLVDLTVTMMEEQNR